MVASVVDASGRILILTPFGRDAAHLSKVLGAEGFDCLVCANASTVIAESRAGVSVIITTEEVLRSADGGVLAEGLKDQPAWSAVPVLVFYTPRDTRDPVARKLSEPIHQVTDVSFLQRPVSALSLTSAVENACRDRKRQYVTRALLERLEKARDDSQRAKKIAEDANESKSRFLANMSHEIRTPLGAMLGFAELLREPDLPDGEKLEFIATIERNGQALTRLIDDILDLSKVEAGKMVIESAPFPLRRLLAEIRETVGVLAREKAIELRVDEAGALPSLVVSDKARVRQILLNLVGNAVKFTKAGRVTLAVSAETDADRGAAKLIFTVSDTGRGIAAADQGNLFQPFVQGDSTTTRTFGGTGLGLVLSRRLAEALGGGVRLVTSTFGRGSVFEATIRVGLASVGDELEDFGRANVPVELAGVHVLVADDSPDNQLLVKRMLERRGASVDLASNGREAVDRALATDYDVVLMDVQMPLLDGHAATRELRHKSYDRPIVALTAHAMKEERDRCRRSGCDGYLTKPIDHVLLVKTVAELASARGARLH